MRIVVVLALFTVSCGNFPEAKVPSEHSEFTRITTPLPYDDVLIFERDAACIYVTTKGITAVAKNNKGC